MKEILTIFIVISSVLHVDGDQKSITMINFSGHADSPYFQGEVMQGGVDTQTHITKDSTLLSARYMLVGKDSEGKDCHIFIDNEATLPSADGTTYPQIVTDSKAINKLIKKPLSGKLDNVNGQLVIRIFQKDSIQ